MRAGDIFYSVIQKDNDPFEQPRITKFIVEVIDNDYSYPIISTKKDKWGRYYAFKESQIYLTYKDALVEKKKIIEKIEKWEKEKREQDRLYFEEQERKEKQRQIEHDKQVRKQVVDEIRFLIHTITHWSGQTTLYGKIMDILNQVENWQPIYKSKINKNIKIF